MDGWKNLTQNRRSNVTFRYCEDHSVRVPLDYTGGHLLIVACDSQATTRYLKKMTQ